MTSLDNFHKIPFALQYYKIIASFQFQGISGGYNFNNVNAIHNVLLNFIPDYYSNKYSNTGTICDIRNGIGNPLYTYRVLVYYNK